jgi:hypothetical protein
MFWITVGQARRQTARPMGPSTIERSSVFGGMVNSTLQTEDWRLAIHGLKIGDCRLTDWGLASIVNRQSV